MKSLHTHHTSKKNFLEENAVFSACLIFSHETLLFVGNIALNFANKISAKKTTAALKSRECRDISEILSEIASCNGRNEKKDPLAGRERRGKNTR